MKSKTKNNQNILSAINDLGKSLRLEFRKGLKSTERILRTEILRVEERVEETEEKLREEIKESNRNLTTKIDGIAKGVDDLRTDNTVGADQIRDLRERVTKLESPQTA